MGLFDAAFGLVGDVAKIALAPVEIVAGVARVVTKPVAELAKEIAEEVEDWSK